ncbi:hypothetical protein K9L97_05485 [Candidatus Woesearchaeota archaeon]|nr:hypothetical protein [Candidatus Woesearchaeota archaeon]
MQYLEQMQRTARIASFNRSNSVEQEPTANEKIQEILGMVQQQKDHSNRILQLCQNKIYSLEKEVNILRGELAKATENINKINDKEVVKRSREALFNRQEKAPMDKPIDRTGVAPKDVQIEQIFNFSGRRF